MKTTLLTLSHSALAMLCIGAAALGQAKPLAGTAGEIGTPARLSVYQFILTSASFATRVSHNNDTAIADKGQKFLVLNFTVQNPGKQIVRLGAGSVKFTVVSADNETDAGARYMSVCGIRSAEKPVKVERA